MLRRTTEQAGADAGGRMTERRAWLRERRWDRSLRSRRARAAWVAGVAAVGAVCVAIGVEAAWDPVVDVDQTTAARLHTYALAHPLWVRLLTDFTNAAGPWTWRVVCGLAAVGFAVRRRYRTALWAATTLVVAAIVDVGVKTLVDRARPHFAEAVSHALGPSFPSGHALTSTVGAAILLLMVRPVTSGLARRAVEAAAVAVPLITGYTRVALGVHWVSDVVAGWLLGVATVSLTVAAFEEWGGKVPATPEETAHRLPEAGG